MVLQSLHRLMSHETMTQQVIDGVDVEESQLKAPNVAVSVAAELISKGY